MNLADCYRILGLRHGASFGDIKAAYRRLVRQYHPDMNPNDVQAKERFIALTEAYKVLELVARAAEVTGSSTSDKGGDGTSSKPSPEVTVTVTRSQPPRPDRVVISPPLSEADQHLKQTSYQQLQQHLKGRRFPRAIALVEGLAQRIPNDPEVRQWQAITYQRWGRYLIQTKQFDKARVYLKKALRTDPHNRSLWTEVERDFRQLEQMY